MAAGPQGRTNSAGGSEPKDNMPEIWRETLGQCSGIVWAFDLERAAGSAGPTNSDEVVNQT